MNLEDKFLHLIAQENDRCILYLQSSKGHVRLEYRDMWKDGMGNLSRIRIVNPRLGICTAPNSWEHLVSSLEANDISEEELERALDRRIDSKILEAYRLLKEFKTSLGETYVNEVIESRGNRSFRDDISELFRSLVKTPTKPKPSLTIIEGGEDT